MNKSFVVPQAAFVNAVKASLLIAENCDPDRCLHTVRLNVYPDRLTLSASDGHRASLITLALDLHSSVSAPPDTFEVYLPVAALREFTKAAKPSRKKTTGTPKLTMALDGAIWRCAWVGGSYGMAEDKSGTIPPLDQVIPRQVNADQRYGKTPKKAQPDPDGYVTGISPRYLREAGEWCELLVPNDATTRIQIGSNLLDPIRYDVSDNTVGLEGVLIVMPKRL